MYHLFIYTFHDIVIIAMTSFDRRIEETYGKTPVTSNADENNNQTVVTQSETSNKTTDRNIRFEKNLI